VYFAFAAIYIVLSIVFIIDVLRQPPMVLSAVCKVLLIIALLVVPVFAWIVYGFWRIKQSRL